MKMNLNSEKKYVPEANDLFPENTLEEDQWGIYLNGKLKVIEYDELLKLMTYGKINSNHVSEIKEDEVCLIAVPNKDRLQIKYDVDEFKDVLHSWTKIKLFKQIKQNLVYFICLMGVYALVFFLEMTPIIFILSIYTIQICSTLYQKYQELKLIKKDNDLFIENYRNEFRYEYWLVNLDYRSKIKSYSGIAAWIVIFVIQMTVFKNDNNGIDVAALVKSQVYTEPWRLFTGPMMHGNFIHILMNCVVMASLAIIVETSLDKKLVVPIWIFGAVSGSILSCIFIETTSVGASGGILAFVGFIYMTTYLKPGLLPKHLFQSMIKIIFFMSLLSFFAWSIIDHAAHLGGLISGMLLAWIYCKYMINKPFGEKILSILGYVSELSFVLIFIFTGYILLK